MIFWSGIAAFYGLNLFFSLNANLNNPIVHPLVPISKDMIWLFILAIVVTGSRQAINARKRAYTLALALAVLHLVFPAIVSAVLMVKHAALVEYNYIRLMKNIMMYTALVYLFAVAVYSRDTHHYFLRIMICCVTASLLTAVALYFTVEAQLKSSDARMYGTYGNPNAVGFMALLNIALTYAYARMDEGESVLHRLTVYAGLVSSVAALMLSASYSALLATILYFVSLQVFGRYLDVTPTPGRVPIVRAAIFAVLIVSAWSKLSGIPVPLFERLVSLYMSRTLSSFGVRAHDYGEVFMQKVQTPLSVLFGNLPKEYIQFDSSLLTFYYHFGLFGVVILAVPPMALVWSVRSVKGGVEKLLGPRDGRLVAYVVPALLMFFLINLPLQYQYHAFPANYFYSVVTGLTIVVCGKKAMSFAGERLIWNRPVRPPETEVTGRALSL